MKLRLSTITFIIFALLKVNGFSQTISTPTINVAASATICAGSTINFTYTTIGTYTTGNIFTIQLSNPSGSFATLPVTMGTVAATQATATTTTTRTGGYVVPYNTATSSLYRVRVISSNPSVNGSDNGYGFTVTAPTTSLTTTFTSVCQNENVSIALAKTCNFPAGNTFSFQLSDATGSFASPTTLATYTSTAAGNYTLNIPSGTPAGTNYQIQAVSSNTNTPNSTTTTFTVNAPSGTPGVFGNGAWNVYCYNGLNNFTGSNYQGWYTENNLSFTTSSRLGNNNNLSPCMADGSSGNAYAGCPFPGVQYSVSYMRTGIPCGLYQINIPSYDDYVYLYINGVQTYSAPYTGTGVTNIWTGFIGPTTNVEFRYSNNGGPGNLAANFISLNPLSITTPVVTICSGTSATISATNSNTVTAVSYSWAPSALASPPTGSLTISATPTTSTTFTVFATDAASTNNTGCAVTATTNITVSPVANTSVTVTFPPPANTYTYTSTCYGVNTATLTATGANTYTWSPATGLSSVNGYSVVANPSVTTTYTVSGSNNCTTANASTVITVQDQPTLPATTTFGNNVWNAYCNNNMTLSSYYGYYTENNLSFVSSPTRWNANTGPATCTTSSTGLPYSGCVFGGTQWSISYKRTGIPCGYYQIDIPSHDDNVYLIINGTTVFTAGCCAAATNVWSGFIGPSTMVEVQIVNNGGPGNLSITFTPSTYPVLSPPATICPSTTTTLTANYIAGANYAWNDGSGGSTLSTTTGTTTVGSPTVSTSYTCTVTDPVTTCSASAAVLITVNPLPTTSVTPTSGTISCAINTFTLNATGANTYTWSPTAGLSAATGNSVVATPTTTTIYTVSGSNNCATVTATSTITVVPLVTPTVYPTGQWNAYCYGDVTFTNYYGYYTELGTGASTFDFNSTTRWSASTAIPSTANSTNGQSYKGCTMPNNNWGISFKRTGFPCGTYSVNFTVDDAYYFYVNGALIAQRTASGSTLGAWTGVLCATSQVEIRCTQSTGTASLTATFIPVNTSTTTTQNTWVGGTSTDWFTAANWCGGSGGIPTTTNDVVIIAAGAQYLPTIGASGAQCKSVLINPATASLTPTSTTLTAIPAATLTIGSTNNLDVYGNWFNRGVFVPNTGSVTFQGSTAATVSCTSTENFYNLNINNSGGITLSSGIHQVSGVMSFTTGIVTQNATLQILNGAGVSGANNSSYVDGFMVKYGTNAFTFPLGTGNIYRPIAMSAPGLATDNFTAKYFYANPYLAYPTTTWDPNLDHLSGCEYWILNRTGGTSNVNVTLSWNTNSCGVTDLPTLLVARWDAGLNAWKNHGNGGATAITATSGTIITSAPVTSFSPFTLASSLASTNPLPIELLYFTATAVNNTADLTWATATETNNNYFTLEKSKDGVTFDFFKQVNSEALNGNSTAILNYKTYDVSPYSGINYYRLKQTDFNGNYKYSNIAQVTFDKQSFVSIFPNPASNTVYINVSADYDNASLKFMDALGREVLSQKINSSNVNSINTSALTPGMYYVVIDNGNGLNKTKVTIQKIAWCIAHMLFLNMHII